MRAIGANIRIYWKGKVEDELSRALGFGAEPTADRSWPKVIESIAPSGTSSTEFPRNPKDPKPVNSIMVVVERRKGHCWTSCRRRERV